MVNSGLNPTMDIRSHLILFTMNHYTLSKGTVVVEVTTNHILIKSEFSQQQPQVLCKCNWTYKIQVQTLSRNNEGLHKIKAFIHKDLSFLPL